MVEECKVYTCDRCGTIYICKRIGTGPSENSDLDGYKLLPGTWNERSRYGGMSVDQRVHLCPTCDAMFRTLLKRFWNLEEKDDGDH